jgi:hypothetical protein
MIPSTGNNTIGNRAVTARGTTSRIHHTAIQAATPAMLLMTGLPESSSIKNTNRKHRNGPLMNFKILTNWFIKELI